MRSPSGETYLRSPAPGSDVALRLKPSDMQEVIVWACKEFPWLGTPQVDYPMSQEEDVPGKFNLAVEEHYLDIPASCRPSGGGGDNQHSSSSWVRPNKELLRFIMRKVYDEAVSEPDRLNRYRPFSPTVYGETSFDFAWEVVERLGMTPDDAFLDLGSGVGQVVLQAAASSQCGNCCGIEVAPVPLHYARRMDQSFRAWMDWFGKSYSPYELHEGDFLLEEHREKILSATVLFVNNWAFGPEVDHKLKEIFAELRDGVRVVSSKSFCPLNSRITARNLSDIGSIMYVSEIRTNDGVGGSVSWTGRSVSYFLHVMDRSKLERYFQGVKSRAEEQEANRKRRKRKRVVATNVRQVDNLVNCRPRPLVDILPKETTGNSVVAEAKIDTLLGSWKRDMLGFLKLMQSSQYGRALQAMIAEERERQTRLKSQRKELEFKIDYLSEESRQLLAMRLEETGVRADNVIREAENMVLRNRELTERLARLAAEIPMLEDEVYKNIIYLLNEEFVKRRKLEESIRCLSSIVEDLVETQPPGSTPHNCFTLNSI